MRVSDHGGRPRAERGAHPHGQPAQPGGELLCAIVGALQRCTPPCVVVNWILPLPCWLRDSTGALVGGSILPGPQCSLSALVRNTAQLPQVELEARPRRLLGANTADCLHSGIVYGTAAMLDGMVAQIRAALGAPDATVVATERCPTVRAHGVCDGYCVPRDAGAGRVR